MVWGVRPRCFWVAGLFFWGGWWVAGLPAVGWRSVSVRCRLLGVQCVVDARQDAGATGYGPGAGWLPIAL